MKTFTIKIVTSTSSCAIIALFMTLSTFLMLSILNSDQIKLDQSQTKLQQSTLPNINQNGRLAVAESKLLPLEPLLQRGIGTHKRVLNAGPSNDCTLGADGPVLLSPVCDTHADVTLVILVTSAPEHFLQRKAIRNTWGKRRHISAVVNKALKGTVQPWKTIFMLGSTSNISLQVQIQEEARLEGDILLGDYVDSYRNLTIKVQQGLCWALRNCNARYVLKTDDDCFVNTELFTQFLEKYNKQTTNLYAGYAMKALDVIRNPLNKWHVSRDSYASSKYHPYASGTGYVISRDVLQLMVQKAPDVNFFAMEDAYTGVLAKRIGISPLDTNRFVLNNVNWNMCNYLYLLVIHQVSPEQQYLGHMYSEEALDPEKCSQTEEYSNWI